MARIRFQRNPNGLSTLEFCSGVLGAVYSMFTFFILFGRKERAEGRRIVLGIKFPFFAGNLDKKFTVTPPDPKDAFGDASRAACSYFAP